MKWNINARIFAILTVTVVISSLAVTAITYNIFSQVVESRFRENLQLTARHLATGVSISLLFRDVSLMSRLSKTVMQDPAVIGVRIEDDKGEQIFKLGSVEGKHIDVPVYMAESEESIVFLPSGRKKALGTISIFYTEKHLREILERLVYKIALAVMLVIVIMTVVSYYTVSRAIVNPLIGLLQAVREVSGGNLDVVIKEGSLPEIAELSRAFSDMLISLKEHQELLRKTYEESAKQKVLADVGRFAFAVAHEIKNPLGIIKGSMDLLRKEEVDKATKLQLLGFIEEEVKRIDGLIKDFLQLAKFSKPSLKVINIKDFLQNLKEKICMNGCDFEISVEAEVNEITADPVKLERIMVNLVRNAVEAGAKRILIRVTQGEEGWVIQVHDDGPGVGEEEKDKIFQPFYTTKPSGTGLGLAIVSQEAYSMGGKVWVEDSHLGGACFCVFLPRRGEDGADSSGR